MGSKCAADRARRRRRRLGLTVLTVAAAVLLFVRPVLTVDDSPSAAASSGSGVDHYPQRIGYDGSPAALPDEPGPLAAMFTNNNFGVSYDVAVSPTGRLWRLDSRTSSLSPDGRRLLFLQGEAVRRPGALTLHDVTTGNRRAFDIGYGDSRYIFRAFRYGLNLQPSITWAPGESRVLLSAAERSHPYLQRPMVLDLRTGSLTAVGSGDPAGFRSASQPVTARKLGGRTAKGGIIVTTTDLRSGAASDLRLQLDQPWRSDSFGLSASVSLDGSTLMLVERAKGARGAHPDVTLRLFSMQDGHELPSRSVSHHDLGCSSVTWLGDDPVLPTKTLGHPAGSVQVTTDGSRSLVALHPRLQSFCVRWAADALEGGHGWALFGTWASAWTWYWYLVLPLLLVPVAGITAVWQSRRRTVTRTSSIALRR